MEICCNPKQALGLDQCQGRLIDSAEIANTCCPTILLTFLSGYTKINTSSCMFVSLLLAQVGPGSFANGTFIDTEKYFNKTSGATT